MKSKIFDDFFYFFSKIIIFLPLVFIFIGLILRFNQKKEYNFNKKNLSSVKTFFSPTPKDSNLIFDFDGPWQCFFEMKEATITAYIKNKKIKLELETDLKKSYFLIEKDCFYQWDENQFSGNKSCGVGPYLVFFESVLRNNKNAFLDFFLKNYLNQEVFSLKDICKKEKIDENNFLLPKNIFFKNTSF